MEQPKTAAVVHYFDTQGHRIACGVPGFERSTKHPRAVTCPPCVRVLRGEDNHGEEGRAAEASSGVHEHA